MKLIKPFVFTFALLGTSILAFALGNTEVTKSIPRAAITFNPGSSMLTETDKGALRKLVQDAQAKGTISQVTVSAWSDKALPRHGQKLLDSDRTLAAARIKAVEDFLKAETTVSDVDTYNMAETANWLARTFHTKDAELRSVFGRTGAEVPVTKDEFHVIKKEGGPSMAVAVVEFSSMRAAPSPAPNTTVTP